MRTVYHSHLSRLHDTEALEGSTGQWGCCVHEQRHVCHGIGRHDLEHVQYVIHAQRKGICIRLKKRITT